jgi:hypothetical protein
MAKKKEKLVKDPKPYRWLDEVRKKLPHLLEDAASLSPFEDVLTSQWVDKDHIGVGIEIKEGVYPSGIYFTYGARIYSDKVIMFCDADYAEGLSDKDNPGPAREEYETDMPRLWAYLRQLPRPMHSFGDWSPF